MIDINITFFIQCINFLVSMFFINSLIVAPIRSVMAKRRTELQQAHKEIEDVRVHIDALLTTYTRAITEANYEAKEQQAHVIAKAKADAEMRIAKGKEYWMSVFLDFEEELAVQALTLSTELSISVDTFSHTIVQRLVH